MIDSNDPIRFAGATLDKHRHVCAFFDSPEQEDRVMGPFVQDGLERKEKAFHIVDPDPVWQAAYLRRLERRGIDVATSLSNHQFVIKTWDDAYLRDGHFDQNAMLALIEDVLIGGHAEGFPLTRLVAHMEWALEDRPGVDDLIEYEARLNYILPRYKDPVI